MSEIGRAARFEKVATLVVLVGLTCVGAILRLSGASTRPVDFDEIHLLKCAILQLPNTDGPLGSLLLRPFILLTDFSGFYLHLWAALWGTTAIVAMYFLTLKIFKSNLVALGSAAFLTFSPLSVVYAQRGRPYSLLLFISIFMYYFFLRAYANGGFLYWVLFAFFATLATCTHLVAAQVLVALAAAVLFLFLFGSMFGVTHPPSRRTVVLSIGIGALASSVGLLDLLSPTNSYYLVSRFGSLPDGFFAFLRSLLVGLAGGVDIQTGPWRLNDYLATLFFILSLFGVLNLVKQRRADLAIILVFSIAVPALIMFSTLAATPKHTWLRYVSHLVIPYGLLVTLGVSYVLCRLPLSHSGFLSKVLFFLMVFLSPYIILRQTLAWKAMHGAGQSWVNANNLPFEHSELAIRAYLSATDRDADLMWLMNRERKNPLPVFRVSRDFSTLLLLTNTTLPNTEIVVPEESEVPGSTLYGGIYLFFPFNWNKQLKCDVLSKIKGVRGRFRELDRPDLDLERLGGFKLCELEG